MCVLRLLCAAACVAAAEKPLSIFPASNPGMQTLLNSTSHGDKLYNLRTPDGTSFYVLHVHGSPAEMGRAQGALLGDVMLEFINDKLPQFYRDQIDSVPLQGLPEWLQKIVKSAGEAAAPGVFSTLLEFVHDTQVSYNKQKWDPDSEIGGIAEGICARGLYFSFLSLVPHSFSFPPPR